MLADVEVLLTLACFIPLLDAIYHLMKLSQERDYFICDFMQAVKVCQGELARWFIDAPSAFSTDDFSQYHDILSMTSRELPLLWNLMPGDNGISHLYFEFGYTRVFACCHDKSTGEMSYVTQKEFYRCQNNVERQFSGKRFGFFFQHFFFIFFL